MIYSDFDATRALPKVASNATVSILLFRLYLYCAKTHIALAVLSILIRGRAASKTPANRPTSVLVHDVLHACVGPTYQHDDADAEYNRIGGGQSNVLPSFVPLPFLDQLEPKQRWKVEGEARYEQTRDDSEEGVEEGNSFCDNLKHSKVSTCPFLQ